MRMHRSTPLVCVLLAVCAGGASAQEPAAAATPPAAAAPANGWNCLVEPYFLIPTITGTSGIRGLTADIDASSGDILGALDIGAMLYFEVNNPQWAFSLDGMYMDLGASAGTRLGTVDLDLKQTGIMLAGYGRIKPWAELMAGVQFNVIKAALQSSGPQGVNLEGDKNWVDPYFGVRLTLPRQDKWRFAFMGAIGGLGVGSDFAWQLFPQMGYRFHPHFELTGGFRVLSMNYDQGTGNTQFIYDLITYGPQVGARLHF